MIRTIPDFIPAAKKGRKALYESGPMSVLTIRLPKETNQKLRIFFRNSADYDSLSHVIATAVDQFLASR